MIVNQHADGGLAVHPPEAASNAFVLALAPTLLTVGGEGTVEQDIDEGKFPPQGAVRGRLGRALTDQGVLILRLTVP